jgi:hypothetical protein
MMTNANVRPQPGQLSQEFLNWLNSEAGKKDVAKTVNASLVVVEGLEAKRRVKAEELHTPITR